MREIKFRAWDKRKKYMEEISWPWAILDNTIYDITGGRKHKEKDDIILMQYTGLKDKNGKEIYEADIIIADWSFKEPTEIKWPEFYYNLIEYGLDGEDLEVIGNLYENPELLKKDR
jgi:uncharacterized phage protein (TIGR01671 family)